MKTSKTAFVALAVLVLGICGVIFISLKDRADKKRYDAIIASQSNTYRMVAYLDGFHYKKVPDMAKNAAHWELQRSSFAPLETGAVNLAVRTLIGVYGQESAALEIYKTMLEARKWSHDLSQSGQNMEVLERAMPQYVRNIVKGYVVRNQSDYYWMSRYMPVDDIRRIIIANHDPEDSFDNKLEIWLNSLSIHDTATRKMIIKLMPTRQLIFMKHHASLPKSEVITMVRERKLDTYESYRVFESGGFKQSELKSFVNKHLNNVVFTDNLFKLHANKMIRKSTLLQELQRRSTENLCTFEFRQEQKEPITYSQYARIVFSSVKSEQDYYIASDYIEKTGESTKEAFHNLLYESKGWLIK